MLDKRNLLVLPAVLLTVASGILHGFMTQRWGTDERMSQAAAKLVDVPEQVSEWRLHGERPLSDSALEMLQCAGYINRIYKHAETGRQITVTVMVGPGSTMSIHTPEICYESKNFSLLGAKRMVDVADEADGTHAMWAVDFETNDLNKQNLRVHYGWSNGKAWAAPNRPRLAFAGERVLYKMQIAEVDPVSDIDRVDSTLQFMNKFFPLLQEYIKRPKP